MWTCWITLQSSLRRGEKSWFGISSRLYDKLRRREKRSERRLQFSFFKVLFQLIYCLYEVEFNEQFLRGAHILPMGFSDWILLFFHPKRKSHRAKSIFIWGHHRQWDGDGLGRFALYYASEREGERNNITRWWCLRLHDAELCSLLPVVGWWIWASNNNS